MERYEYTCRITLMADNAGEAELRAASIIANAMQNRDVIADGMPAGYLSFDDIEIAPRQGS